jgi:non-heme chloroperoxidase
MVVGTFLCLMPYSRSCAQAPGSPPTVQMIQVEPDVKLEVLDWGGKGRSLVLLAGMGDTAHVFDTVAPKLTAKYHDTGSPGAGSEVRANPNL